MEQVANQVIFFLLSAIIVVCSIMAVTSRRILRAATYLLFVLFATAGYYFQLDYHFLGAVQVTIYAGGILVLFVFAILLTSKLGEKSDRISSRKRAWGLHGRCAGSRYLRIYPPDPRLLPLAVCPGWRARHEDGGPCAYGHGQISVSVAL